jgi:UDP-glucose 4-epimerase
MLKDKVLLITGGTGSFGNTILKRFLMTDVRQIVIFSRDEKSRKTCASRFGTPRLDLY